jgi:hypothetical protein
MIPADGGAIGVAPVRYIQFCDIGLPYDDLVNHHSVFASGYRLVSVGCIVYDLGGCCFFTYCHSSLCCV